MRALLLLLPRLARMIAQLIGDREVPTRAKLVLAAIALYLVSPVDLVPDFVPVLGYLDDLLLAAVVVDGLVTYLDRGLLLRYWPASAESLETVAAMARRLARWVPARVKMRVFGGGAQAA